MLLHQCCSNGDHEEENLERSAKLIEQKIIKVLQESTKTTSKSSPRQKVRETRVNDFVKITKKNRFSREKSKDELRRVRRGNALAEEMLRWQRSAVVEVLPPGNLDGFSHHYDKLHTYPHKLYTHLYPFYHHDSLFSLQQ